MKGPIEKFRNRMGECGEALEMYGHFSRKYNFSPDFWIRYVYVHSISCLDYFMKELILDKSVEIFSNFLDNRDISLLPPKLVSEKVVARHLFDISVSNKISMIIHFEKCMNDVVRYKSFQKSQSISDGLSYICFCNDKWSAISKKMGIKRRECISILDNISKRRDEIVHNADYMTSDKLELNSCGYKEAESAYHFILKLGESINDIFG